MPNIEDMNPTRVDEDRRRHKTHRYVRRLFEVFPADQSAAVQLIESDGRFREVCDEYEACNEAIEHLTRSKFDDDLRREYCALRLQIEAELLRYILEHRSSEEQH
jgi:hypothetical protein